MSARQGPRAAAHADAPDERVAVQVDIQVAVQAAGASNHELHAVLDALLLHIQLLQTKHPRHSSRHSVAHRHTRTQAHLLGGCVGAGQDDERERLPEGVVLLLQAAGDALHRRQPVELAHKLQRRRATLRITTATALNSAHESERRDTTVERQRGTWYDSVGASTCVAARTFWPIESGLRKKLEPRCAAVTVTVSCSVTLTPESTTFLQTWNKETTSQVARMHAMCAGDSDRDRAADPTILAPRN